MRSLPLFPAVAICLFWFSSGSTVQCQEPERIHSVFTSDARFGYLISPGLKLNSVFNKLTSELELYGGLLINEKTVLGAAAGINVGYPDINYKYIGIIAQYIYKPENFIHYSWQTMIFYGTSRIKGIGNKTSEESAFYALEPGANVEVNLARTFRLVAGISYRFVPFKGNESGPDPFFKNSDLAGVNLRIGFITGRLLDVLK